MMRTRLFAIIFFGFLTLNFASLSNMKRLIALLSQFLFLQCSNMFVRTGVTNEHVPYHADLAPLNLAWHVRVVRA